MLFSDKLYESTRSGKYFRHDLPDFDIRFRISFILTNGRELLEREFKEIGDIHISISGPKPSVWWIFRIIWTFTVGMTLFTLVWDRK